MPAQQSGSWRRRRYAALTAVGRCRSPTSARHDSVKRWRKRPTETWARSLTGCGTERRSGCAPGADDSQCFMARALPQGGPIRRAYPLTEARSGSLSLAWRCDCERQGSPRTFWPRMTGAAGVPTASRDRLDRKTILALIAMGIAVLVIANDFTALSVALPPIEKRFDTDVGTVQWVINAYSLSFGVLIVVGGRLADIFGRRRMFVVGSAIFAGFSVLGGVAPNMGWLITCRALMGIGGALMWPSIPGLTYAVLRS